MVAQSYTLVVEDETGQAIVFAKQLDSNQYELTINKLKNQLELDGFLNASVLEKNTLRDSTYLKIDRGNRETIAAIQIMGIPPAWRARLRLDSLYYKGQVVDSIYFQSTAQKILRFASNNGYPFAHLQLVDVTKTKNGIWINYQFDRKNFFTFGKLQLITEAKINPNFLKLYLGIKEGAVYSKSLVEKIRDKVNALSFLSLQNDPIIAFTDDYKASIYLDIKENKVSYIDGVLGVAPQTDISQGALLTGEIDFKLRNPFGRAVAFDFSLKKFLEQSQNFKMAVRYPYLLASPLGIEVKLDMMRFDSTFFNFNYQLGISYSFSADRQLMVYYNKKNSNVLRNSDPRFGQLAKMESNNYGLLLSLRRLDYIPNPRKGYFFSLDVNAGIKNYTLPSELERRNQTIGYGGQIEKYFPIKGKSTVKTHIRFEGISDSSFTENQSFRIGGFNDIRGFDENIFQASNYLLYGIAFRVLPNQDSYLETFIEGGLVSLHIKEDDFINPLGAGLSYSFKTGPGFFSISYAYGIENLKTLSLNRSRVHFGFISYF